MSPLTQRADDGLVDDAWRLFIAVELPVEVRDRLRAALGPVVEANQEHLRFMDPDTWHVTLAFLGSVHPSWSDVIEDAMTSAAQRHEASDVWLGRAGRFGRGVLFHGFDDSSYAALQALGADLRGALARQGVPFDTKPLHPHLTLARPRDPRGIGVSRSRLAEVDQAVAAIGEPVHWPLRTVTLLRSHLGDGPVRYEPLLRVPLRS